MFEQEDKTKPVIAAIVGPFATASAFLLFILSLAEYFRRGFVSLFLDFRILAAVTLALWAVAVWTEEPPRREWFGIVTLAILLVACGLILWPMLAPFGRLGIVVFACGLAIFLMVFLAGVKPSEKAD
jgi:hypothetical protein